jgi:hypothetical protein
VTLIIYLYFDQETKISADRKALKMIKQGFSLTEETDCLILTKEL